MHVQTSSLLQRHARGRLCAPTVANTPHDTYMVVGGLSRTKPSQAHLLCESSSRADKRDTIQNFVVASFHIVVAAGISFGVVSQVPHLMGLLPVLSRQAHELTSIHLALLLMTVAWHALAETVANKPLLLFLCLGLVAKSSVLLELHQLKRQNSITSLCPNHKKSTRCVNRHKSISWYHP